jgi:hypothetical protein
MGGAKLFVRVHTLKAERKLRMPHTARMPVQDGTIIPDNPW